MEPVLIGAGIGALGSAAQGKSPLTGALLGGVTGGAFGGSQSLFGDKIASAFGQGAVGGTSQGIQAATGELAKIVPSAGIQGLGQSTISNLDKIPLDQIDDFAGAFNVGQSSLGSGIKISAGDLRSGMPSANMPLADRINAMNTSQLFNYTPPTMLDKVQGFGNDAYSWAKSNPLSAGGFALKGVEALTAPEPKMDISAQRPVRQGQYQGYTPPTVANNVAPQILPLPINKTGMLQLDSVLAQNPELRKLYPDLFGG